MDEPWETYVYVFSRDFGDPVSEESALLGACFGLQTSAVPGLRD